MKYYYDRSSRSLRDLRINEIVRVQPLNSKHVWKLGKVLLQYALRSYVVEVDGKLITRNRKFLGLHLNLILFYLRLITLILIIVAIAKIVKSMCLIRLHVIKVMNLPMLNVLVLE